MTNGGPAQKRPRISRGYFLKIILFFKRFTPNVHQYSPINLGDNKPFSSKRFYYFVGYVTKNKKGYGNEYPNKMYYTIFCFPYNFFFPHERCHFLLLFSIFVFGSIKYGIRNHFPCQPTNHPSVITTS